MRLATIQHQGAWQAAVRYPEGWVAVSELNRVVDAQRPTDLFDLIQTGRLGEFQTQLPSDRPPAAEFIRPEDTVFGPLYRQPGKIWGIGLNYAAHAADLSETAPTSAPASFMKPQTAVIGPGDDIRIPVMSNRTTAEAELGIVIGTKAKDVPRQDWWSVVAGLTTIIDMTAEDILRQNPRYLTLSKSFDTFFSFGPELVTPDEIGDPAVLNVQTLLNDQVMAEDVVANMTFPPDYLVAFHSRVMTLMPGDVISTGTPGAAVIAHGDVAACRIDGFTTLTNPVVDLKNE
jgi:2-keto-4-pentenoate hydratase/2-oxohepta-3-ene-1,7-dioic acid hydratase in catechol pathway